MKKSVILFLILLVFYPVRAADVDTLLARKVALNFLQERASLDGRKQGQPFVLQLLRPEKSDGGAALYYVFNITGQPGFIIISAEDRVFPVLAYSFESSFKENGEMPAALAGWLELTGKQIRFVRQKQLIPEKETEEVWSRYLNPPAKGALDIQEVAPLLSTRWNQGRYYNTLCPEDTAGQDGHVWVGCVAVAMAQVMKYWDYPDYGSGEHSYTDYNYGGQSADFAHTFYDWTAMPNSLSGYNTPVATLMYHCGVSINMNYGTSGSSASVGYTATALKNYFDYSRHITTAAKSTYTEEKWDSLVRSQLDLGQPLIYAGGNHAFNIDGYQDPNYFHVNWGWGGAYNGYFYLDDLTPGGYDFTSGQYAVINIRPDCGEAPAAIDTITDFSGTIWDNGYSYYNYLNCSDARTLIAPPGANVIHLMFNSFMTVAGQDTLYVYDGEDEASPLLLALSGDTLPAELLTSSGKVYLRFVSDGFTTERGYEIRFTSSKEDAGITQILEPVSRTCGRQEDSLVVIVKNYGIEALTNIPVVADVLTPGGTESLRATLPGPLERDQSDTLLVGLVSTLDPGDYHFTCYTNLPGDFLIHENDTSKKEIFIKAPGAIPFFENVDSLGYNMGDWTDKNGYTWINRDQQEGGNAFFTTMPGDRYDQFFIYDRDLKPVTARTGVWFDYRIRKGEQWQSDTVILNASEKIHFIVSSDCGRGYDTLFTIDQSNYLSDTSFRRVFVPLGEYAGEGVIIGFTTEWDSGFYAIDYDNILVADTIYNNVISGSAICAGEALHISGTGARGGVGKLSYRWEQSADGESWGPAASPDNTQNYDVPGLSSSTYFRRVVYDSLFLADTSNVVYVRVVPWPVPAISSDTTVCSGDTVRLTVSGGESYLWNTGETGTTITVVPGQNTTYKVVVTNAGLCATDTSVTVTVHPLPEVSLGPDTAACNGESITLDAGDFTSYQWNTGVNTRQITVSVPGTYTVTVANVYGCEEADTIHVTFNTCTGTGRMDEEKIIVYPNPSSGVFYIKGLLAADVTKITVMNVNGMMIKEIIPVQEILSVSLENQPLGIYLIRIINKNGATVVKRVRKAGKPLPSR